MGLGGHEQGDVGPQVLEPCAAARGLSPLTPASSRALFMSGFRGLGSLLCRIHLDLCLELRPELFLLLGRSSPFLGHGGARWRGEAGSPPGSGSGWRAVLVQRPCVYSVPLQVIPSAQGVLLPPWVLRGSIPQGHGGPSLPRESKWLRSRGWGGGRGKAP